MSFYCYLLKSVKTPTSTSTYIGFTVDNRRRLRQHNGEITAGAKRTSKGRPWEHVAIISGFPNKIVALQFEWQWQHPATSRVVREILTVNPNKRGVKTKIDILHCILQTKLWSQLDLQVNFFNKSAREYFLKISKNVDYIPRNKFCYGGLEDLPTFESCINSENKENTTSSNLSPAQNDSNCNSCALCQRGCAGLVWSCGGCTESVHTSCLARVCGKMSEQNCLIPKMASCPHCHTRFAWPDIARTSRHVEPNLMFAYYRYQSSNVPIKIEPSTSNSLRSVDDNDNESRVDDAYDYDYDYEHDTYDDEIFIEL